MIRVLSAMLLMLCVVWCHAAGVPPALAKQLAADDSDEKIIAIRALLSSGDEFSWEVLRALDEDRVKADAAGAVLVLERPDGLIDALKVQPLAALPGGADDIVLNNRVRRALEDALAVLQLFSPERDVRLKSATELASGTTLEMVPLISKALASESDTQIKKLLTTAKASAELKSDDAQVRLQAVQVLGDSEDQQIKTLLSGMLRKEGDAFAEADETVRTAVGAAIRKIDSSLRIGVVLGQIFTGISLGSVLLLAALGLAITYGLMGVINMAHGEFIMIGAYATYVVQNLFRSYLPGAFDWYVVAAIPAAFLAAAVVGIVLERTVIRFLYGRPLETLLATWGISLILIQAVRTLFGAQNVTVENPSWLSGGYQMFSNLTLPYSRLAIIVFAVLVLLAMAWLIARTRLGLFVRGVTQNRPMASCMGVNTALVDRYAFALGAGIAGLAGCALSQIGNVGPDLGQRYIVDSFMVVVLGGVGQIAGTVYAALGLGIISKILENLSGAVLAKIMVLIMIVIFIQKRPQGLFAMKGRSAEN